MALIAQIYVQSFGEMLLQSGKGLSAHLQYLTDSLVFLTDLSVSVILGQWSLCIGFSWAAIKDQFYMNDSVNHTVDS